MQPLTAVESTELMPHLAVDVSDAMSNSSEQGSDRAANVFLASLPQHWDEGVLREHLNAFGNLESLRINADRRYAFANFETTSAADACIATLNGVLVEGSNAALHVARAMHSEVADGPNSRLFIRGLPQSMNENTLRRIAEPYGVVTEVTVVVHHDGTCKGSGFVAFDSLDAATRFLETHDGKDIEVPSAVSATPSAKVRLTVKYSESAAARDARQKRNRERIAERAASGQTPPTSLRGGNGALSQVPSSLKSLRSTRSSRNRANTSPHHREESIPTSPHPKTPAVAFGAAMTAAHAPRPAGKQHTFGTHSMCSNASSSAGRPLVLQGTTRGFPITGDIFLGPVGAISSAEAAVEILANLSESPSMVAPYRARNGETGFALRMRNSEDVDTVVAALQGARFIGGAPPLSCWKFA